MSSEPAISALRVRGVAGDIVAEVDMGSCTCVGDVQQHLTGTSGAPCFSHKLILGARVLTSDEILSSLGYPEELQLLQATFNDAAGVQLLKQVIAEDMVGVERALRVPACPDFQDEDGNTPLWTAADMGHEDIVQLLCLAGADKNKTTGCETPLFAAVARGHVGVARVLCDASVDVDTGFPGNTPLLMACQHGHADVVRVLCNAGADTAKPNKHGCFPLGMAAGRGHAAVVQVLCDAGVDVNAGSDSDGDTPLLTAVYWGHAAVVRVLCNLGADTAKPDDLGQSPLMLATSKQRPDLVRLLSKRQVARTIAGTSGKALSSKAPRAQIVIEAKAGTKAGAIRISEPTGKDISVIRRAFLGKLERKNTVAIRGFLQTSDPCVRADPECVLAAVRKVSSAFEFAADVLKSNKDFILKVLKIEGVWKNYTADGSNCDAIVRAAESFQADEEIVAVAAMALLNYGLSKKWQQNSQSWPECIEIYAPPFLRANREFVLESWKSSRR